MTYVIDFARARSAEDIAQYIGVRSDIFRLILQAGQTPDLPPHIYAKHRIPKRRTPGKHRLVWDVTLGEARAAHLAFARRFTDYAESSIAGYPHPAAYGYIRDRGTLKNAKQHCGQQWLLRCDIEDFFGTITRGRLRGAFLIWGFSEEAAEALASFSTIDGKLALGLNASPLLANLVALPIDDKLTALAAATGCRYTRYADDITISGNDPPDAASVLEVLDSEGFRPSPSKSRTTRIGQAHFVTGLSVADPSGPRLPRPFKKDLRQELYHARKHGLQAHLQKRNEQHQKGINRLDGCVRYAVSIEPEFGKRVRDIWRDILVQNGSRVSYAPRHEKSGVSAHLLLDESMFTSSGEDAVGLICIALEDLSLFRAFVLTQIASYARDPFAQGRASHLELKKLHFSSAPEALRQPYFTFLALMPFRAYVAFRRAQGGMTRELYAELLRALLRRRLVDYDRADLTIHFEQNNSVNEPFLTELVSTVYQDLEEEKNRRPLRVPRIQVHSKGDEPAMLVADSMLWAFQRAIAQDSVPELDFKRFERLRDRFRVMIDLDTHKEFSRRRPLAIGLASK